MNEAELAAVREDVIESIERSAEVYGLSRSAGRVYGVLYFAEEPLSIAELVEETGYAKSTISNVTRQLSRIGMLHRRSSSGGGRRVQFSAEPDLWYVLQDVFRQYVDREMDVSQRTLSRALNRLDDLEGDQVEAERERIQALADTYDELQALLHLSVEHAPEDLIAAIEDGPAE